jgi:hypothetical protein
VKSVTWRHFLARFAVNKACRERVKLKAPERIATVLEPSISRLMGISEPLDSSAGTAGKAISAV